MGFVDDRSVIGQCSWWFGSLTRRKQVDSLLTNSVNQQYRHHLAKELSVLHLIAIGVGATIGAGVYILVGTVAREHSGPALAISFLIAGFAAALSAFCYAELASRCPSAGSAYHYSYICVGEGVAWLVGWALILEYMVGGAAVARGISPNLSLLFGGSDSLPSFLSRHYVPFLDTFIDPCAAFLVFIVTGLLCIGIKESVFVQAVVTTVNICALIFVIVAGSYLCFKSGWVGYELPAGYFPYGVNGMLTGSATVFFAYIGFDSVASTAEEVRHPQRDLPVGIGIALLICCMLYMLVSIVTVGLVPYYAMDPDTPISSAFSSQGMQWASYIVTVGAVTALCSTLMGSLLPQPRILMAMARDGLLPPFFSDINRKSQVPVKSTIVTGAAASLLAFLMDVSELAGMVSVGTLTAFTMVAVSVLILRYIPPTVVPLPSSLQKSIDSVTLLYSSLSQDAHAGDLSKNCTIVGGETSATSPFIGKKYSKIRFISSDEMRRKVAGWTIATTCVGILIMAYGASAFDIPGLLRLLISGAGASIILCGLLVLTMIDQDDARHNFGHSGGFICPCVPLLPVASILVNVYLLINLGGETWGRVSVWMVVGFIVYGVYGWRHSSLLDAVYVPATHVDEIYRAFVDRPSHTSTQ